MRVRTFLWFWFAAAAGIITYALLDLHSNPWLHQESGFTMQPSWAGLKDLPHWGGRLMRHQAWTLLVANAIFGGGLIAIVGSSIAEWWERCKKRR